MLNVCLDGFPECIFELLRQHDCSLLSSIVWLGHKQKKFIQKERSASFKKSKEGQIHNGATMQNSLKSWQYASRSRNLIAVLLIV